ncbi:alpha/beta fold hydrolase [Marinihelvus fidelis]|uniref:Alpha/beta fold hydrolase n=1 Tax=Marinihelvus fidelis TaxID=2613842 RepID=A0A5N0T430_9GAMM|nr:alpha/beta fold hydrolase [Marinihelvus fidelis]KAA9129825.1 alpha/beta fold hydrolase [Marinihelvus fidelis]
MTSARTKTGLAYTAIFLFGGVIALLVTELAGLSRVELSPWHSLRLGKLQRTCVGGQVSTFSAWQECEEKLITRSGEMLAEAVEHWPALSRFDPASPTYDRQFTPDWNHTVELVPPRPVGGAVLLHGLSDSPYSLRAVALRLHDLGFHVVAPRLPGHGLFPGALNDARWQHWHKVTALSARHLRESLGEDAPVIMVGYSNGAALAMDHALSAIEHPDAPDYVLPDRMVFLSPALAVTRFARLGAAMETLARLPGLEGLAWNSVVPEFDPVKYNSFPVRAGYEIEVLLDHVERRLARFYEDGRLDALPPVLTLQSVVDDTVPPGPSLHRLYDRVHDERSELVLFDTNRETRVEGFLTPQGDHLAQLFSPDAVRDFSVTLVTNRKGPDGAMREVEAVTRSAGQSQTTRSPLGLVWPDNIYSLSHVAVPFPPDDPVYGDDASDGLRMGGLAVKGERGALQVPADLLARLRYNPFHDYLEQRLEAFVQPLIADQ